MLSRNSSKLFNIASHLALSDRAHDIQKKNYVCHEEWPQENGLSIEVFRTPQAAAIAVFRNHPIELKGTYSVLWLRMADGQDGFAAVRGAQAQMVLTNVNGVLTFFVTTDMCDRRWISRTQGLFPLPCSMRPWLPRAYSRLPLVHGFPAVGV